MTARCVIKLAPKFSIDLNHRSVVGDGLRIWVGGESGSGKSTAFMLLAEQMLTAGVQVVVLDAHGEFGELWKVRPSSTVALGYGGRPVGEESVDYALEIVRRGESLLLDLSHWADISPAKLDVFMLEFIKGLYALRRKEPKRTVLFIEEAQNFVPQNQSAGQYENVKSFIGALTGGRKFGLYFVLASQRQSLVDSNAIAACNVRLFLRVTEEKDWKKVREYIPKELKITFGDKKKSDLMLFDSGEAIVVSRWVPTGRYQLNEPVSGLAKFFQVQDARD